jgi:hypothetical protein
MENYSNDSHLSHHPLSAHELEGLSCEPFFDSLLTVENGFVAIHFNGCNSLYCLFSECYLYRSEWFHHLNFFIY